MPAGLAAALIPVAIGAVGGLGQALVGKQQAEREAKTRKETTLPGRRRVPLSRGQQKIADTLGQGTGGISPLQIGGLGINQSPQQMDIAQRIEQLKQGTAQVQPQFTQPQAKNPFA